jgi:predicted nucleic acid-binding protein
VTTIVSDTSPINYLVLIGEIDLLRKLFDEILIPPAVYAEIQDPRTPPRVYAWAAHLPPWAKVREPFELDLSIGLGAGEVQAISLAIELGIPAILMDERRGRIAAELRGLIPVGTLTILDSADRRGLVDFEQAVAKLQITSFHIDPDLIAFLLEEVRARKGR